MRITLGGAFGITARRCARRIRASTSMSAARRAITSSNSSISWSEKLVAWRMKRSVNCPSICARRSGVTCATAVSISWKVMARAMGHAASFAGNSCGPPKERFAEIRAEIECRRRHRPVEQEALHLRASGRAQQLELLGRLDALSGGVELERAAEPGDGAGDCGAVGPAGELSHEGLVDLDLVERKHAQVAERRVAGAEIVEHDVDAARLELMQD